MHETKIENEVFIPQLISEGYKHRTDIKKYNDIETNFWYHLERLNGEFSEAEKKQISEIMGLAKVKNNVGNKSFCDTPFVLGTDYTGNNKKLNIKIK